MDYLIHKKGLKPLRMGVMTYQGSPGTLEVVKGVELLIKKLYEPKGLCKLVAKEWIDFQPVDVTNQVRNLIQAKTEFIIGLGTPSMLMAFVRARQSLDDYSISTITYTYHGLALMGMKTGNWKQFENMYVCNGHIASLKKDSQAFKFFKTLQAKYGLHEGDWNSIGLTGLSQAILAVRGIEHAVKKVGLANLTGQAVYDALSTGTFTEDELMGVLPGLSYSKEAPFPQNPKIMLEVVKDGKFQVADPNWLPVPPGVPKW
jgi:branched-chain amino acid transport system substrate-binding protein